VAKINLSANVDIDSKLAEKIKKKITSAAVTRALSNKIRPLVEEQISEAIGGKNDAGNTNIAKLLKPHIQGGDELVGRLGVSDPRDPGTPDYEKLNNAWRELVPGKDRAAKFTVSIDRQNIDKLITIKYTIDKDAFYDAKVCKFVYYKEGERVTINWMRDYIEGASVEGYGFSSPSSKSFQRVARSGNLSRVSRTGLGFLIKIPNGSFRIQPLGTNPFDAATGSVAKKLRSKEFKENVIKALKSALRSK
jgi:hypothetical protein